MTICRSCGSAVNSNFCPNCGTPMSASPQLNCPRCNCTLAPGTRFCPSCGNALATPSYGQQQSYPPQQMPQSQNKLGSYVIGALGGAAAVIGGEMLLHDVERGIERHVERDVVRDEWVGEHRHHHHHHHHHHRRRCACGHEYGMDIDICPRCRRRWGHW